MDTPVPGASHGWSPRAQAVVFVVAAIVGAFDLGSYLYLRHASVDFVLAARERAMPAVRLGETVSWQSQAPGVRSGWWGPSPGGTWSVRPEATLVVRLGDPADVPLRLVVAARAFVHDPLLPLREVDVMVNGRKVATWKFDRIQAAEYHASIPREAMTADGILHITFRVSDAPSPAGLGISADRRKLGICVIQWRLEPADR